jgi:hypothetical protein
VNTGGRSCRWCRIAKGDLMTGATVVDDAWDGAVVAERHQRKKNRYL